MCLNKIEITSIFEWDWRIFHKFWTRKTELFLHGLEARHFAVSEISIRPLERSDPELRTAAVDFSTLQNL